MKLILIIISLVNINFTSAAQALTKERVQKLKNCVGKISIEGSSSIGTGFFISPNGNVLTCWHVIAPAITADSLGHIIDIKRIYLEMVTGEKTEIQIPSYFFYEKNTDAVTNDYCILSQVKPLNKRADFYKLGSFDNIEEGDEIYTAGYPLGIANQFISRGMLSTKYIDSSLSLIAAGRVTGILKRTVALLDITLNKGNSGGPVIRLTSNINNDIVIGIADFLLNPFGETAEKINKDLEDFKINYVLQNQDTVLKKTNQISITESMKVFSQAIIYSSNGISGCVSINHFLQELK